MMDRSETARLTLGAMQNPVRGFLHGGAALFSIAGTALLWQRASGHPSERLALTVFGLSMLALFSVSALYHSIDWEPTRKKRVQRVDHSMIYVLIAGTYTPLCLIALPRIWGIPMLVVAWVTALAGVILKMVRLGVGEKSSGSWLYIVMGWGAVITLPVLVTSLNAAQLVLLGVGGVLYTVGAVILGRKRPDPSPTRFGYHEVWHSLTIAAGGCHFALVATLL